MLPRWRPFSRFALVGAGGFLVNILVFALATQGLGAHHLAAAVLAFIMAVASNFYWNRRWTFGHRFGRVRFQAGRFLGTSVGAFLVAAAVLQVLVVAMAIQETFAQMIAVACAGPINFFVNDSWTFPATAPDVDHNGDRPGTARTKIRAPWIVLPTYNEADNLEAIVPRVLAAVQPVAPGARVLIVDDSSPDGTGAIADRLAAQLAAVEVLHRPAKGGLGRAYVAGFRRALGGGADAVIEMDADFSHDPADLPRLIGAAAQADLVLGSRYVQGGAAKDWALGRRVLSRAGRAYARLVLGVDVQDFTGGFKCFRSSVLRTLDLDAVQAQGYGFQIELTYRAFQQGFRVSEVPIVFGPRAAGRSKMSTKIALEAVWTVIVLRRSTRPAAARETKSGGSSARREHAYPNGPFSAAPNDLT